MDNNNNENRFQDYSAPEETGASGEYGASGQQSGGYNLNGQYYSNSSGSYQAGDPAGTQQYESSYSGEAQQSYQNQNTYTGGMQQQYNGAYNGGTQNYSSYSTNGYHYSNGNYGAGVNAVPLDRKGRPLRNRFGMKLTFSILGILFGMFLLLGEALLGLIPLILAIVALVTTCVANGAYKQGNWDSFRAAAKTATVLLWVVFGIWIVFMVLLVIGIIAILAFGYRLSSVTDQFDTKDDDSGYYYDYSDDSDDADDSDDWDDTDDDSFTQNTDSGDFTDTNGERVPMVKGFNKFTLEGAVIELPMKVSDFCEAGFEISESDAEEELDANYSYGYSYYDADGNYLGTIFVYNTSDSPIKVKQGIIGGITVNDSGDTELELVGGLEFGDDTDDAREVFGSAVTYMNVSDSYSSYEWYFEDAGYSTSVELDFNEYGEMDTVWILNYEELQ